jgi:hypothetical protein
VGGRRGREIRRRAQVHTRWSTASAGRAELTGRVHGAEREEGHAREKAVADRWGPPVRRRGRAGAWPGWAELGWFGLLFLFLFLWIF